MSITQITSETCVMERSGQYVLGKVKVIDWIEEIAQKLYNTKHLSFFILTTTSWRCYCFNFFLQNVLHQFLL